MIFAPRAGFVQGSGQLLPHRNRARHRAECQAQRTGVALNLRRPQAGREDASNTSQHIFLTEMRCSQVRNLHRIMGGHHGNTRERFRIWAESVIPRQRFRGDNGHVESAQLLN